MMEHIHDIHKQRSNLIANLEHETLKALLAIITNKNFSPGERINAIYAYRDLTTTKG